MITKICFPSCNIPVKPLLLRPPPALPGRKACVNPSRRIRCLYMRCPTAEVNRLASIETSTKYSNSALFRSCVPYTKKTHTCELTIKKSPSVARVNENQSNRNDLRGLFKVSKRERSRYSALWPFNAGSAEQKSTDNMLTKLWGNETIGNVFAEAKNRHQQSLEDDSSLRMTIAIIWEKALTSINLLSIWASLGIVVHRRCCYYNTRFARIHIPGESNFSKALDFASSYSL